MIELNTMLMIGSAGSKVGKTELACALLRKFCKKTHIIGIKITTIKETDGQCPRGDEGCGICPSLEGDFCITEETDSNSSKDTARLLAAGASRVFWLRTRKTHLKEAVADLLDKIDPASVSICESNSLRKVVKPGLFLMVQDPALKIWKNSAEQVKKYADRIVASDSSDFDFLLENIKLICGKWILTKKATIIIMAGGGSQRMGTDKSLLLIDGQPIIKRICEQIRDCFDQILISANEKDKFAFLGLKVIPDKVPEQGPLMGIASALEASNNELNFITACDIPYIELGCVRRMLAEADRSNADIVVPIRNSSMYEPLFAVYRRSTLKVINKVLYSGSRKISDVFALCKVKTVQLDNADWLANLNTITEYEEYQKKHSSEL